MTTLIALIRGGVGRLLRLLLDRSAVGRSTVGWLGGFRDVVSRLRTRLVTFGLLGLPGLLGLFGLFVDFGFFLLFFRGEAVVLAALVFRFK